MIDRLDKKSSIEDMYHKINEMIDVINYVKTGNVWIVVYYSDDDEPVVTPFANYQAANECLQYFRKEYPYCYMEEWEPLKYFTQPDGLKGRYK